MNPNLEKLTHHHPSLIGMESCKKVAACIPLIKTEDGYEVLFEIRSYKIDSQPGDICFPGGMMEPGETPVETAVREMKEELLIEASQIQVLGLMDVLFSESNLMMYPYAVTLHDYKGTYSKDEVEETFSVPLKFFLETDPQVYRVETKVCPDDNFPYELVYGGRNYKWRKRQESIMFYIYGKYAIWGMTAKVMRSFVGIIKEL